MIKLEDVQKQLSANHIKYYDIFSSGNIVNDGLCIGDLSALIKFVKEQKCSFVLCYEHYISPDEYIISDEDYSQLPYGIPTDFMAELEKSVQEYNTKLLHLDFDLPQFIIIACLHDGHYFYTLFENSLSVDDMEIAPSQEMLETIMQSKQDSLKNAKKNHMDLLEKQKKELREYILSDASFQNQTNKHLRRNYIIDVLSSEFGEHIESLRALWYREEFHSVYHGAIDFVELLWREYKSRIRN